MSASGQDIPRALIWALVPMPQCVILDTIFCNRPIRQCHLSSVLHLSNNYISGVVRRMEGLKWIQRIDNSDYLYFDEEVFRIFLIMKTEAIIKEKEETQLLHERLIICEVCETQYDELAMANCYDATTHSIQCKKCRSSLDNSSFTYESSVAYANTEELFQYRNWLQILHQWIPRVPCYDEWFLVSSPSTLKAQLPQQKDSTSPNSVKFAPISSTIRVELTFDDPPIASEVNTEVPAAVPSWHQYQSLLVEDETTSEEEEEEEEIEMMD